MGELSAQTQGLFCVQAMKIKRRKTHTCSFHLEKYNFWQKLCMSVCGQDCVTEHAWPPEQRDNDFLSWGTDSTLAPDRQDLLEGEGR